MTNEEYFKIDCMSASQFKDFYKCESYGLAKYNGLIKYKTNSAMLVGSYIDAYFTDDFDKFKEKNKNLLYTKTAIKKEEFTEDNLLAEFKKANEIIERINQDEYFKNLITGKNQVIVSGLINGVRFKGKLDSLKNNDIVDLKIMADVKEKWNNGKYENFAKVYGYDIQLAIYQYLLTMETFEEYNCKLAVATKEETTDLRIFKLSDETLKTAFDKVFDLAPRYDMIKKGIIDPVSCGCCEWCKSNKKLNESMEEII